MAKGGYQKRRIQQQKQELRARRKRAAMRKKLFTYIVVVALIMAFGGTAIAVFLGGTTKPAASTSPTPSASPSASPTPVACHTPSPADTGKRTFSGPPCMSISPSKSYTATVVTSKGTMKVQLFAAQAPETVNSFVFLAEHKYFDGLIFHRVFPKFGGANTDMIQGGDPQGTGQGGPGYQIKNEYAIPFSQPGFLAMANAGPDTNGSQFFVLNGPWSGGNAATCAANASSQGCYSVFGKVLSGLDVVHKIAASPGTPISGGAGGNTPKPPVKIISVTIAVK